MFKYFLSSFMLWSVVTYNMLFLDSLMQNVVNLRQLVNAAASWSASRLVQTDVSIITMVLFASLSKTVECCY